MNIKLIKYIVVAIALVLGILFCLQPNTNGWSTNDTATFYIQIPYDKVDDYLFEVESRLNAYPEWILAISHGGYSQFEKEYYPYILSDTDFELTAGRFKSLKIQTLLREYSSYFENQFIINKNYTDLDNELMRFYVFTDRLISLIIDKKDILIDEIVDPLHYGINPNYNFETETLEIKIVFKENVNSTKDIIAQLQHELNDVNSLFNIDVIKNISGTVYTKKVEKALFGNQINSLYNVFPELDKSEFNKRKRTLKNDNSNFSSLIDELSAIEEKLIELQLTFPKNNILIKLIGTEEKGGGLLSTFISQSSAKRYKFIINQYVKDLNLYLLASYKTRSSLPYPSKEMLPTKLQQKYLLANKYIIYKF